jgi:hypothetical protein
MLSLHAQIVAASLSAAFILSVIELIRRHRLQERYAWIWLLLGISMLIGSLVKGAINDIAKFLGVYQPAVGLLAIVIFGILLLVLHLTVVISRLSEQSTRLAQTLALMSAHEQRSDPAAEDLTQSEAAAVVSALTTQRASGRKEA